MRNILLLLFSLVAVDAAVPDLLSIIKNFRVSFHDNVLMIKPLPALEVRIEMVDGHLNGIMNGTTPMTVLTGINYEAVYSDISFVRRRTIRFQTLTCTQLSPMLGRYIVQELLMAFGMSKSETRNFNVCAFRVGVLETNESYEVKFTRGVFEAKFSLGTMDTPAAHYINQHLANSKGFFGFKLKIQMVAGEVEFVGTDIDNNEFVRIRPQAITDDFHRVAEAMSDLQVINFLQLGVYFDKLLTNDHFSVPGFEIIDSGTMSTMEALWMSLVQLSGHYMGIGRNVVETNFDRMFDEQEAMKTIELISERLAEK